jgi:flagellar biosynthesis/type III secretory pathway M-ring protein FliF/YscJ
MSKARSGKLGDLKLLALSAAIVLFCVVALVMRAHKSPEKNTALSAADEAATSAVSQESSTKGEEEQTTVSGSDSSEGKDAGGAGSSTTEEQQRRLRDMKEQIPPGQVIVF